MIPRRTSDYNKNFYATEARFHNIPGVFRNISKSGNIWGGDFYRTWMR